MDCGDYLLKKYSNDYTKFFQDLRKLVKRLATARTDANGIFHKGICMIDIKPDNLCIGKNSKMYFIDADNKFLLFFDDNSDLKNRITYMIFQVYAVLNNNNINNIEISETGITEESYMDMITFCRNSQKENRPFTPFNMLLFYYITDQKLYKNSLESTRQNVLDSLKNHDYEKKDWFQRNLITGSFYEHVSLDGTQRKSKSLQDKSLQDKSSSDQGGCTIS